MDNKIYLMSIQRSLAHKIMKTKSSVRRDFYNKVWWKIKYMLLKKFKFDSEKYDDEEWSGISFKLDDDEILSFLKNEVGEYNARKI